MGFTTNQSWKSHTNPKLRNADDGLHVYVQNVGQGAVELSTVYVDSNLKTFTPDPNYPDNVLEEGKTADLTSSGNYITNAKLNIKVATTDGTFMTRTGTVPSSSGGSGSGTQYQIAVTESANGAIAPGTVCYAAGSSPSFTITPNVVVIILRGLLLMRVHRHLLRGLCIYQFAALSAAGTLTATFAVDSVMYHIVVTQGANGVIAPLERLVMLLVLVRALRLLRILVIILRV